MTNPRQLANQRHPDHADEWEAERKYGVPITTAPEPCRGCDYQHHDKEQEPCYRCPDNPDVDPCVLCPGNQAHSDQPPCEWPDGACEHCRIGGTLPQAEALDRWMRGDDGA